MSSSKNTPANIITSPAYTDLTSTLTKSPTTTSSSPTQARNKSHSTSSTSSDAYAQKAMNNTSTWQPKLDRRQSWSNEEYKHLMQSRSGSTGGSMRNMGDDGFSEEGHGHGHQGC